MNAKKLPDHQLIAYLDGEADTELVTLIEQTPEYLERARDLAQWHNQLAQVGQHLQRPSSLELGEYQLGLLPPERAREVARYLQQHPHAAHQQTILQDFLSEIAPPDPSPASPDLVMSFRVLVAQLISGGGWQTAAAGVRGSQEGVYQADDIQVILEVDTDLENAAHKVIIGVIMGDISFDVATVDLLAGDQSEAVASVMVDEDGHFIFSDLEPGMYALVIQDPQTAVNLHIPPLHI